MKRDPLTDALSDRLHYSAEGLLVIDCPACNCSKRETWLDEGRGTAYSRCSECQTIYASPRLTRTVRHAELSTTFALGHHAESLETSRRPALAYEAGVLKKLVSRGRLLDIGCSLGGFFDYFSPGDWELHGIELSPSAAIAASERTGATVYVGTLEEASIPDGFFDLVTMIDVLYYMDSPGAVLAKVRAVLKPGGFFAVELAGLNYTLRRRRGVVSYLLEGVWTTLRSDSSYLNWCSRIGVERLLHSSGFEIVETRIVPPPTLSKFRGVIGTAHTTLARAALRSGIACQDWAPKYLTIAKLSSSSVRERQQETVSSKASYLAP